jgi:cyanate permease
MTAGSVGVLLMGAGFDHFHSYTVALVGLTAAMLLALLLLTFLGPYRFAAEPRLHEPTAPLEVPDVA